MQYTHHHYLVGEPMGLPLPLFNYSLYKFFAVLHIAFEKFNLTIWEQWEVEIVENQHRLRYDGLKIL